MRIQAFINGVLTGFILGMLFAPDSGNETRRRINRKAAGLKDSIRDTYDEVAGSVSGTINQVKSSAGSLANEGKRMYGNSSSNMGTTGTDITV